jgi:hypothetical protein
MPAPLTATAHAAQHPLFASTTPPAGPDEELDGEFEDEEFDDELDDEDAEDDELDDEEIDDWGDEEEGGE